MTAKLQTTAKGTRTIASEFRRIKKADSEGRLRGLVLASITSDGVVEQFVVDAGGASRIELMGMVLDLQTQVSAQKI